MESVTISKRFAQINNCKAENNNDACMELSLERRPASRSDRRRFHRKASGLPLYAVGSIDRNGFLWSEAKGFISVCVCVEQKLGRIIAVALLYPRGVGPHIPFGITKHSSTVLACPCCVVPARSINFT
jgi:hypothetical protein